MSEAPDHPPICPTLELSIVVPALDEQDNIGPLVEQIEQAIVQAGIAAELIVVNDGSTDATVERLTALAQQRPWLKVLHHQRPCGQSVAMRSGIIAACGQFIATLDADLQNDPADLPAMLERLRRNEADMVQGDRSANRRDNVIRRTSSAVGRGARRMLIGDPIRDTGCSARVMRAEIAKQLPLQFHGMHRFVPAYARMLGARVVEMPVRHRPRTAGQTKYGLGVLNRGVSGLFDCLAVRWMGKRFRTAATASHNGKGEPT